MNDIRMVPGGSDPWPDRPEALGKGPLASLWRLFSQPKGMSPLAASLWRLFTSRPALLPPPVAPPLRPALSVVRSGGRLVLWTQRALTRDSPKKSVLLCGAADRRDSPDIQPFLQSVAPRLRDTQPLPERQIRVRSRLDAVPALTQLDIRPTDENIWLLNPFDERSTPLDLGQLVQTPELARSLSVLLIGDDRRSPTERCSDGARQLVCAVVLALNELAGKHWTFQDFLRALGSSDQITAITARYPLAKALAARILGDGQLARSALATLETELDPLRRVSSLYGTTCLSVWLMADALRLPAIGQVPHDQAGPFAPHRTQWRYN